MINFTSISGENFLQIFLAIELWLSTLYPNDIVNRFFSFVKAVISDWRRKLSEGNVEALLHIKVEGPEIEEFIKEYSSGAVVFWWDAKKCRKRRNGKRKKYNQRSRKTKQLRFTNEFINTFLERSSDG